MYEIARRDQYGEGDASEFQYQRALRRKAAKRTAWKYQKDLLELKKVV